MKKIYMILLLMFMGMQTVFPCTSAVVSGKATPDGRPLLWKHRDSDAQENKLMYFKGSLYSFIGVINSSDSLGKEIWMGTNSAGFSIMNTMSYNMNYGKKINVPDDQEGLFMKAALERCATLEDFEKFLDEGKGKWGIAANFGCIDAKGGAAYYETGYFEYMKFDVNDPLVAPDGYLIRTNFSFSGDNEHGLGYIRFQTAQTLFNEHYKKDKISLEFILRDADRNLQHSLTNLDLNKMPLPDEKKVTFIPFRDYIVRYSTVSSMVVQGVKPGEDVRLTTVWTRIGWPLTTVVTPVWVAAGENLPSVCIAPAGKTAAINAAALELKKKAFPAGVDNGRDYLNLSSVMNKQKTGFVQSLLPKEKEIADRTNRLVKKWREKGFNESEALEQYSWMEKYIKDIYRLNPD